MIHHQLAASQAGMVGKRPFRRNSRHPIQDHPMCGRFTLRTPNQEIAELFDLSDVPNLPPRYNIAPTQPIASVRQSETGNRELAMLHWGLIPFWANDAKIGNRMINARAESVADKPSFKRAFKSRRCLVLADGFYEWKTMDGKKQPFCIRLKAASVFGFAGLWERWNKEGVIESCTIITTHANELMKSIHDRMPVILSPDQYDQWLEPDCQDTNALQRMLQPFAPEAMEAYPVSSAVNNPRNDGEACVVPSSAAGLSQGMLWEPEPPSN